MVGRAIVCGPLARVVIKETVAMTLVAALLGRHFFAYRPARVLAYATLALACTNISAAGMITSFGSSSTLIAAHAWGWKTPFMFTHFGWKAIVGILLANGVYYAWFREEFKKLALKREPLGEEGRRPQEPPLWLSCVHILFLIWLIANSHTPLIAAGSFVLFMGFYRGTAPYQSFMDLREPICGVLFGLSDHYERPAGVVDCPCHRELNSEHCPVGFPWH